MDADNYQLISAVAQAAVPVVGAVCYYAAHQYMVRRGWRTNVLDAVARGAALGYLATTKAGLNVTSAEGLSLAAKTALDYAGVKCQESLKGLALPIDHFQDTAEAEVGKLVASSTTASGLVPLLVPVAPEATNNGATQ